MSDATAGETMTTAQSGNGAPAKRETLLTVNGLTKYFPVTPSTSGDVAR